MADNEYIDWGRIGYGSETSFDEETGWEKANAQKRSLVSDMMFVAVDGTDPAIHFKHIVDEAFRITEADLAKAARSIIDSRIETTLSGVDDKGDPFQAYSPSYLRKKHASNVNLLGDEKGNGHEHMLDALDYKVFTNVNRSGGQQAIVIGILGDADTVLRARIHDQGAVVRTRNYKLMGVSGKMSPKKRTSRDTRKYVGKRKLVTNIPQREWLHPTKEEIEAAREILIQCVLEHISEHGTPGYRDPEFNRLIPLEDPGFRKRVPGGGGFNTYRR